MIERISGTRGKPRFAWIAVATAIAVAIGLAAWANRDSIAIWLAPTKKATSPRRKAALEADELF